MITKQEIVEKIIKTERQPAKERGGAQADVNIALCKYWGKRDENLNLPLTSSLSISLPGLGATTEVTSSDQPTLIINDEELPSDDQAAVRVFDYLSLFTKEPMMVKTQSTVPLAAGLASSASGFAALVKALNDYFEWKVDAQGLSILARLGSGSACRSVYDGFVEWQAGERDDGMDSVAHPIYTKWEELRVGLLLLSGAPKKIGSTSGMKQTHYTSTLYKSWPEKVEENLQAIKDAISKKDFEQLGQHAETNALAMHATMMDAWPPILYWQPETVAAIHKVHEIREGGRPVYLTMDAGPNVKVLFLEQDVDIVNETFPAIQTIIPFRSSQ